MEKPKIFIVVGTRPEAIKMGPVAIELKKYSDRCQPLLVSTGQHREILHNSLESFGVSTDEDLKIMQHGATLAQVTARAIEGLDLLVKKHRPACILGQGDTTTTLAAAMVAYYNSVIFGHVEAGLRTKTVLNPFPEEFNRRAAGLVANLHFPPTSWARNNLLREGKDPGTVFVTGNTVVDAVLATADSGEENWYPDFNGRLILMTTHRRENWGEPQRRIASAALRVVDEFPDTMLVVALHPNPTVRETLQPILGQHDRVKLIEPPEYSQFVKLMRRSALILSDSGGVQEEAPAFGVPVLVLRETTERPEGIGAGTAKLVGTDERCIYEEATRLLSDEEAYRQMAHAVSPYGDGKASARIRYVVLKALGLDSPEVGMWHQ
jgi:UDP-N-acetylglucosamine 2-epimerase (non-hydrolysing)